MHRLLDEDTAWGGQEGSGVMGAGEEGPWDPLRPKGGWHLDGRREMGVEAGPAQRPTVLLCW